MQQIVVEPALSQRLGHVGAQVVLCDSEGRALGFFSPLEEPTPMRDLQLESPLSVAEVDELRKNPTGKPLSEILSRLGLS